MKNYVRLVSKSAHTSIIITGLLMLREQKIIDFDFKEEYVSDFSAFPTEHIIEAYINGKKIAFDTYDGSDNMQSETAKKYINNIDAYFKRSFSPEEIKALGEDVAHKIHPLGLFYRVTYPDNPLDSDVKRLPLKSVLLGAKSKKYFTPKKFENKGRDKKIPQVMFFTRLWGDKDNLEVARKRD